MRATSAWVLGILVCLAVGVALSGAGDLIGVPSSIEHNPPLLDENDAEMFSSMTLFGYATGLLSILAGTWAGQALFSGAWHAGFSRRGWLTFCAWSVGTSAVALIGVATHFAFQHSHGPRAFYGQMVVEALAILAVGMCFRFAWARLAEGGQTH